MSIIETAFFKYLQGLTPEDREKHIVECALKGGELLDELCEYFNCYNPTELSWLIEQTKTKGKD